MLNRRHLQLIDSHFRLGYVDVLNVLGFQDDFIELIRRFLQFEVEIEVVVYLYFLSDIFKAQIGNDKRIASFVYRNGIKAVIVGRGSDTGSFQVNRRAKKRFSRGTFTNVPTDAKYSNLKTLIGNFRELEESLERLSDQISSGEKEIQLEDIEAIFVPAGGGGLIAGIASYVKALWPKIKIIGVEPTDAACMARALAAGRRVRLNQVGLFADGVAVAARPHQGEEQPGHGKRGAGKRAAHGS